MQFDRQLKRFDQKLKSDGGVIDAHPTRFESCPNSMEALSHHRSQHKVDFQMQSKRTNDVFAMNRYIHKGKGRRDNSPLVNAQFYENAKSKDRLMKRTDKSFPSFSQQLTRETNMVQHDYSYDQVEIDQSLYSRR